MKLVVVHSPQVVIEDFKKFNEFIDDTLKVMKEEVAAISMSCLVRSGR